MSIGFESTFEYKLIYVFRLPYSDDHKGLLKVGEATVRLTPEASLTVQPSSKVLNDAAKARINQYTNTAGIRYELLHTELAVYYDKEKGELRAFSDHKVHAVLDRSNIKKHDFKESSGREWYETNLDTVKAAIQAVKNGQEALDPSFIGSGVDPIILRPEQKEAVDKTVKHFKKHNRMLWNAKMRFGKTLTALEVAKRLEYKKVIICTHRPVVSDGWYEDFNKIFHDTDYKFGSKNNGETLDSLMTLDKPFVYFASIQDLRGSNMVGGKFDKNQVLFDTNWDMVVVDEAHEGTQTNLGKDVIDKLVARNDDQETRLLQLSGTPFNLLGQYSADEIYTWDYIMEQRAKAEWNSYHFGDNNPYSDLPKLEIYTYNLEKSLPQYIDIADSAFNFREFFRVWTGNPQKDYVVMPPDAKVGEFVYRDDVMAFLNMLTTYDKDNCYPFSNEEFRSYYRHTLWVVPGVKEAKALKALMDEHPVFNSGAFKVVNIAGEGDEDAESNNALDNVKAAIGANPDEGYTITITCGRLTTGVSVPAWTAVLMLAGSFSTSAQSYLQTIFRVQTPANINGRIKTRCSVFDFAPDRTLKMVAEAGKLSTKQGRTSDEEDRRIMGEFLNYCPVIAVSGSNMKPYNVEGMLQQLKRAYTDRIVRNGFDDVMIYNDNLLRLTELELDKFEKLKGIIGKTKQAKKVKDVLVNEQGFTDEEYEQLKAAEGKKKSELTEEQKRLLEERAKKRKQRDDAISILRGISIRIPLLIYGIDKSSAEKITIENFTSLVDDASWAEFMPSGVTKEYFNEFKKYYEQDMFIGAGESIRRTAEAADRLEPAERALEIAKLFSQFKNPDKETVLTPWRVVNMHMGNCLGGYNFFDDDFKELLDTPRFVDNGDVTANTVANLDSKILEINSKTGLYPLYITYSIYRKRLEQYSENELTLEKMQELWDLTVKDNIFVICKTPMARTITKRTLLGYRKGEANIHHFENLVNQLKSKSSQFKEKVSRGNYWKRKENEMKFDAIVGNPPYHEVDGGGTGDSAKPIYNYFVDNAKQLNPKYLSMITPSRWMKGGKGLDKYRKEMMKDKRFVKIFDYENSKECFDYINIDGGVSYFLWDNSYQGKVDYCYISMDGKKYLSRRYLDNGVTDTVIRDIRQQSVFEKIQGLEQYFSNIVSSRNPYGFSSDLFNHPERYQESELSDDKAVGDDRYLIYGVKGKKGGAKRVVGTVIAKSISKESESLSQYKLFFSKAYTTTATVPPEVIVANPYEICTETFLNIGGFDNKQEALNCLKYIKSKFFRAFLFFNRHSMNISRESFASVPMQDFTGKSDIDWTQSVADIDKQLYQKYNLTEDEISFIESTIKPMG